MFDLIFLILQSHFKPHFITQLNRKTIPATMSTYKDFLTTRKRYTTQNAAESIAVIGISGKLPSPASQWP